MATPTRAVAAASSRSAWRTSGRRLSRVAPSPTGMGRASAGGVSQPATSRGKFGGRPTCQDGQAEEGRLSLSLERWDRRSNLFELRARLAGIERRSAPAFDPPSGEFERLLLDSQAFAGDRELAARAARIGIGAGGFGGDGDAADVEGRLSGARIGSARLYRSANPAEQINLVADVDARVVAFAFGCDTLEAELVARLPAVGRACVGRCRWEQAGACLAQYGTGAAQVRCRNAQVGVGDQRLLDQPIERGIGEEAPPAPWRLVLGECRRGRAHEGRLGRSLRRGRAIIRPDHASREGKRGEAGSDQPFHSAAPGWPCACNVLCCIALGMKRSRPRQTT